MRQGNDRAPGAVGDVAAVASLDEPTRRRVYDWVRGSALPVSRDEVAKALGVPRRTAAFHLDRLAELDLLSVTFARRSGRNGPGAGRTAKLYQRSAREVSISLPARQYDLAGQLLAGAVAESEQSGEPPREVLGRRARAMGEAIAREWSGKNAQPDSRDQRKGQHKDQRKDIGRGRSRALVSILQDHGFEPEVKPMAKPGVEGSDIVLHNCPFHALAQEHTDLVCGMNVQLLDGVVDGLRDTGAGEAGVRAVFDPGEGRCCVRVEVPPEHE
jgi:predicted ArsR family transcriptional regulator